MKQQTLTGFEKYGKTTRRAKFLADMDRIIPWPPIPLERMLRIYILQRWFNLSDPAVEEELYDSVAMRSFVGIDPGVEGAPAAEGRQREPAAQRHQDLQRHHC